MLSTFESAFTHAPVGMALVDTSGGLMRVNDALCRIAGQPAEELLRHPFHDLADPRDAEVDAHQFSALLAGQLPTYQVEKRFRHASGSSVWVLMSVSLVRDDGGEPRHLIAQVQDISARKVLEAHLERLVDHDFLTGLFNARRFEQELAQQIKSAARYKGGGAVLLLDLDHFKEVNDRFGHKVGDDLLKTVAIALRSRLRGTDIIARLGGDEFGIILPQVDAAHAELAAEGIVKALRRQMAALADDRIQMSASVGVALFDQLTDVEVLAAADLAMYAAKEAGRDQYAIYRSASGTAARPSSRLPEAERIRQALARNQLALYCQPILNLATNAISQYELLLRLRTDDGELLSPNGFLYVAERFGTIRAIDSWVVHQAATLIADENRAGRDLTLNLNISPKSLADPWLITAIDRALAESRIDPANLVFELSETAAMGNIEQAKSFTQELRSRGCRFALDDFGQGFGACYYLKHLAFDYLKIDGDFIRGFSTDTTDKLVVEAIVGIAKGMGKETVAEFVTDEETMERLRQSGLDYAQGFHVGEPQPIADAFTRTMSA